MLQCQAEWVVSIARPPIRRGWIRIDGERIADVGPRAPSADGAGPVEHVDLGRVAVMPGLVNAHTHLELSWLRGRIPLVRSFPEWIRHVIRLRRESPDDRTVERMAAEAAGDAWRTGTVLLGDIANTSVSLRALAAGRVAAVVFRELIGFDLRNSAAIERVAETWEELSDFPRTARLRVSLAAHAPYSVGPDLFRAIRAKLNDAPEVPGSVHVAESKEELEFLRAGTGAWRTLLEDLCVWDPLWRPPGVGPVEYLDALGFLRNPQLVVHGVHLSSRELETLAIKGVTLVTCPRGNSRTGAGTPPIERFVQSGVRIALGTDSLGSVDDLQMFAELEALRRLAPLLPASELLKAATLNGACGMGFERDFGTLDAGKRADCLAIDLPEGVEDVEEYLLGGVKPEQIHWVNDLLEQRGATESAVQS